jgi:glucose/arabinose dehydrogenase
MIKQYWTLALASAALAAAPLTATAQTAQHPAGANGDWRADAPGVWHHITAADLPAPFASPSVRSRSSVVPRPGGAQLKVPPGFEIKQIAQGLEKPRLMRLAPNGDIFVAETSYGRVRALRLNADNSGVAQNEVFAAGLNLPFGISFYPPDNPQWVYVAQTDKVVRFPYAAGDMKARRAPEVVVAELPHGGNHYSRDVVFSADGKNRRIFATGIRNCVGMAINPATGDLWCSTNERDLLGDNLVPDYLTRVREGAFYGWPWYYIGAHQDPRQPGARPDLKDKVTIPDVLIQAHSASLQMMFYTGDQFPADYKGSAFAAEHGSWNRAARTGYKIIRAPMKNGVATGEYEDFVTGFVVNDSDVWGRPVGVVQAKDGSLLFSEDGNGTIWRVTHKDRASER